MDLLEVMYVFREVPEEIGYTLLVIGSNRSKGGNGKMQEGAEEEKIVQIRVFTRQIRSHSDSSILEPTVTLIPNNSCRFDINIVHDPDKSLTRDTRLVLEKNQQLQLREELAENGFMMITASPKLDGYGGNMIFLTATKDRSRLAIKGSYSDERDGFVFQVTVDHMQMDQQGQAVTLQLPGLQALLCQLALENYIDHPEAILDIVGYGVVGEDALMLLRDIVEQIGPQVNALQDSHEELRKFARMLRIQRWPESEDGESTIKAMLRKINEQGPSS